ncbi:protein EPIDERMAL PATTERNING FACTOR 1-like [Mercurialis annua]|uniref:protein EPIDERMAL PATTERNING FACTOR 1-like n=1 Tax=Mercurialis annua TaxID=3986 RepID=UPI00215EF2DF|nr:protein EPIDERMAL PATTERNING FACTOR 1-like [Mercurialis annua]
MKYSVYIFALVMVGVAILIPRSTLARDCRSLQSHVHEDNDGRKMMDETNEQPLQVAGSRLPDCSHACGSCSPCKLVIVSPLCASLTRASEPCPVSYRCMCNNKAYPVP